MAENGICGSGAPVELAIAHPFASEGLHFYERIARFQKSLYTEIEAACGRRNVPRASGALRQEFDPFLLLPRFAPFLPLIEQIAPSPLSHSARELGAQSGAQWQEILAKFWEAGVGTPVNLEPADALLSWIFLQPYAEYLADHTDWTAPNGTPTVCPLCSGKPQVGALRPGGRRRETLADLLVVWNGVAVPEDCVPRVRRRRRAQARRLHCAGVQPCARRRRATRAIAILKRLT